MGWQPPPTFAAAVETAAIKELIQNRGNDRSGIDIVLKVNVKEKETFDQIRARVDKFVKDTPLTGRVNPPGPVVIWNLIRRCNLTCLHCYSISADVDFPGELRTEKVFSVMDDLKAFHVPVLILSGISEMDSKVRSFGFGADDYVTKPFHREELEIGRAHV